MFYSRRAGSNYYDRGDVTDADYIFGDLTRDGAYYDLDISNIIGVGRRLVKLFVDMKANAAGLRCRMRTNGNTNIYNIEQMHTQVANVSISRCFWVWTDVNGVIEYMFDAGTWFVSTITILGYFKQ